MKAVFKKRRFYKGQFREIGEVMDMDAKHFRAFNRVKAVVPAVKQAPAKKQDPVKKEFELKANLISPEPKQAGQINAEELEELLEEFKPVQPEDSAGDTPRSTRRRRKPNGDGDDAKPEGE